MASATSTIDLIFRGVNLVGGTVNGVISQINRLNASILAATAPLALLTFGIVRMEQAAAKMAITFARDALDASIKFSSAQTNFNKVLQEGDERAEAFTQDVFELSEKYGVAATVVLDAAADFKKSGFTTADSFKLVKDALDGAIAGEIELTEVSVKLRAILAAFGIDASKSALALDKNKEALDLINEAANRFNVDFGELLDGFQRFAPIANLANLSFQETVAVVTAVTEVFQSGDISGRALQTIYNRLVGTNKQVIQSLLNLGIVQEDQNDNLKTGAQLYFELTAALKDLDKTEVQRIATIIAGTDQSGKLAAAIVRGATTAKIASDDFKFFNSAQKEAAEVLKGTRVQLQATEKSYENLRIVIGDKLQKEFRGLTVAVGDLFTIFREQIEKGNLDELFKEINPQLKQLEDIAKQVAAALPEALKEADFTGFSRGIEALFGDLEDVTITSEGLADVITALAETFESAAKFTSVLIDTIQGVGAIVGPIVNAFANMEEGTRQLIGQILAGSVIFATFGGIIGGITAVVGPLIKGFFNLGGAALAFVRGAGPLPGLFSTMSFAATGFGKALTFLAGPLAIGYLIFEIGSLVAKLTGLDKFLADIIEGLIGVFRDIGVIGSDTSIQIKTVDDSLRELGVVSGQTATDLLRASNATFEFQQELDALLAKEEETISGLTELDRLINEIAEGPDQRVEAIDIHDIPQAVLQMEQYIEVVDKTGKVVRKTWRNSSDVVEKSLREQDRAIDKTIQKTAEYQLKLLEIASDERIAVIEATIDLDIAKLEADTQRITAAFKSIDTTIESTGELLGDLFNVFARVDRFDQLKVLDQIDKENKNRATALALQERLVEAQIARINAQTRALVRGESLIKIDATPLAPHLQAILHEVLKAIQLRASADLAEFLLNVDAVPAN